MTLKAVANNPATGNHGTGGAARTILKPPRPPSIPRRQRRSSRPEALAIRMPVDIRSAALTVLAVLAIVLVLQYAQAMIIPIVLGGAHQLRARTGRRLAGAATRSRARWRAAVVLLSLVAAGGWLLYGLRSQATAIVEQLPQAARRLRQIGGKRPADRGHGDPAGAEGRDRARERAANCRDAAAAADRAFSACRSRRRRSTSATTSCGDRSASSPRSDSSC